MTTSATNLTCGVCGGEMLSKDGQEFCPACLLQQGMQASSIVGNAALQNWTPPAIEDLVNRFPHLEIESLIGQGGMGAVYRVRQKDLDRIAALKILPESVASDPSFKERFLREARLLASLSHPHIVTVYEFGQRDGLYFLLMEYVDGVTLRQASLAEPIKRLAPKEGLTVVGQLCDALQFAHDEGVVHRDIKPENILIDKRGRVKIADFGLAKLLGKPADLPTLTRTHQLMGTPAYMAPEQVEGRAGIDHRADIYSLGVVFYELLTGELPLGRFQPPSAKAELDARLDEVVFRTLEKEPDRRYQQASQVRTDMDAIRAGVATGSGSPASSGVRKEFWHWSRILIICWSFIGTVAALHFLTQANTLQNFAISATVVAVVAVLLEALRPQSTAWGWSRWAAGIVLGLVLPAVLLTALIVGMEERSRSAAKANQELVMQGWTDRARLSEQINALRESQPADAAGMSMSDGDYFNEDAGGDGDSMYGGGGPGAGAGASMMGMGAPSDFGGGGFGGMSPASIPPKLKFEGDAVHITNTPELSSEQQTAVKEILTDIHQKYLQLEADHSVVRIKQNAAVETTVFAFPSEWDDLEDELWTRLDDAVNVAHQRRLRDHLPINGLADEGSSVGYDAVGGGMGPGYGSGTLPGLLGWPQPKLVSEQKAKKLATVTIRRQGRWFEWSVPEFELDGRGPQLPTALQRFDLQVAPATTIANARIAYKVHNWALLADCFTPVGRFDWSFGSLTSSVMSDGDQVIDFERYRAEVMAAFQQTTTAVQMSELGGNMYSPTGDEYGQPFEKSVNQGSEQVYQDVMQHSNPEERRQALDRGLKTLPEANSLYMFFSALFYARHYGVDEVTKVFDSQGAVFVSETPDGGTANGMLHIPDGTKIPIQFQLTDGNWQIEAIETPSTSLILQPPRPPAPTEPQTAPPIDEAAADSATSPLNTNSDTNESTTPDSSPFSETELEAVGDDEGESSR